MNWFGMFQLNKRSKQPYGNNKTTSLPCKRITTNNKHATHTHTNSKQKCRAYTTAKPPPQQAHTYTKHRQLLYVRFIHNTRLCEREKET